MSGWFGKALEFCIGATLLGLVGCMAAGAFGLAVLFWKMALTL